MTIPSSTSNTCMRVQRAISSLRMLLWSGARCCTSTKAMPGSRSAGMAEKNASNAARPPADAPMPTTGKAGLSGSTCFCGSLVVGAAGSSVAAPFTGFLVVMKFTCCDGGDMNAGPAVPVQSAPPQRIPAPWRSATWRGGSHQLASPGCKKLAGFFGLGLKKSRRQTLRREWHGSEERARQERTITRPAQPSMQKSQAGASTRNSMPRT